VYDFFMPGRLYKKLYSKKMRRRILRTGYETGLLVILFIAIFAYRSAKNYYALSASVRESQEKLADIQLHNQLNDDFKRQYLEVIAHQTRAQNAADVTFQVIGYAALVSFLVLALARWTMLRDVEEIQEKQDEVDQARIEAEKASRSKSEFLANMSHEIRTPMNAVIGMTTLLLKNAPRPDQIEYCDTIQRAGRSLLRLIQGVLDLSRIEAGKLTLDIAEFSLRRLVRETAEMIRPSISNGVRFDVVVDDQVPEWLKGDSGRIQQILMNLLGNAAKFTDHGSVGLNVSASASGDQEAKLRFDVKDTGIGIPSQAISSLFQPFTQVSPESPREKLGTGLGLSISKRLVETMKGEIQVQSEFGKGAHFCFDVTLPLAEPGSEEIPLTPESLDIRYEGTALVVDDNPANLRVAQSLLEAIGLQAQTAGGGHQAISLIEQNRYDIVLMDCQMPGIDGFETTSAIRAIDKKLGRHTPIAAVTAHTANEVIDRCYEAGMDDFLAKPVDLDQLATVVGRFLTPVPLAQEEVRRPVYETLDANGSDLVETTPPSGSLCNSSSDPSSGSSIGPSTGPSIDFSVLSRLRRLVPPRGEFNSSREVIDELIRLFSASCERSLRLLQDHLKTKQIDAFAAEAHYFKSSSMSVGANGVTTLLEKLEKCKGSAEFPADIEELYAHLEKESAQVLVELKSWWEKERSSA
jgi:signal transduction histidine kinase/CheY-like chemotaxis protein